MISVVAWYLLVQMFTYKLVVIGGDGQPVSWKLTGLARRWETNGLGRMELAITV